MKRAAWGALAGVLLLGALVLQWHIWNPPIAEDPHADAVVVLGYGYDRVEVGRQLAASGAAPNLVISWSDSMRKRQEGLLPPLAGQWLEACDGDYGTYRSFCIVPAPNTTVGEAIAFRDLAAEQGWTSVIVVTEVSHLRRALTVFEEDFDGEVLGVASYPGGLVRNVWRSGDETLSYVKRWLSR